MEMVFWAGMGTLFPFLMTVLGAALVFLIKKQSEDGPCMGFAAGVMGAAAVFSMLLPAMRQNEGGWLTVGFVLGAAMIAGVDALMRRLRRVQGASDSARQRLMMITAITRSPLLGEISYTLFIGPIFFLLYRFFVRPAYAAVSSSHQSLMLFGSLPVVYYFFDYATVVYSDALYRGIGALNEFLPTALLLFYVLFLTAYHAQMQRRADTELQRSMLEAELKQSAVEMEGLRSAENQTAIYQHDMRHHLNAISALLAAGEPEQAEEYIRGVRSDIEAITPKRYCGNELVNLLCSSFENKARRAGVRLTVDAKLPGELSISDTELCSILSNALENALRAVEPLEQSERWISLYCGVRRSKLLIEVKNPYAGRVAIGDGLPRSERQGHGYGCRSIQTIAQRRGGLCQFRAEDGVFSVQLMLPVKEDAAAPKE